MTIRTLLIALSPALVIACATEGEVRQLTAVGLEQAKTVCRAPNAHLAIDNHVSIVVSGARDDEKRRQIGCLSDQLMGRYWWDWIVDDDKPRPGL